MCEIGSECTVKKVGGSAEVKQRLNEIGFNVGTAVTVVSTLNGNIIVRVKDSRIAIDRGMANRIMV
jgi:Fe2+ transport system protein A